MVIMPEMKALQFEFHCCIVCVTERSYNQTYGEESVFDKKTVSLKE